MGAREVWSTHGFGGAGRELGAQGTILGRLCPWLGSTLRRLGAALHLASGHETKARPGKTDCRRSVSKSIGNRQLAN